MRETPPLGTITPDDFRRIREVFEAALERPAVDRRMFIEHAFGGNTVLVAEVERMLAAEDAPDRILDRESLGGSGLPDRVAAACSSCHAVLAAGDRFCRTCGTPTRATHGEDGRFRAGALFANRFRIVARLGRGGMGDVHRADDLELGQPVALKFLTRFRSDECARARLRNEVRLARQLAHPNVCRVYDIGEAHGDLYLSMEYVDGEDLAALLKRIGRLPIDKGIEIARKLCAGLAAAHAKGVLHRDFKPANIMIDGHGEVRIMDFGLAAVASELDVADVRSGTPAYMAPEQLAGKEATKQSDLYALGLVLYELFTGKPPFAAKDLQELQRLREATPATTPSTLIPDIGPRVEDAILRCLEPDPKQRPASALAVAGSLPGGDPLAEALAAGETPSPEMVAAAGPTEGLRPRVALALLAGTIAAIAVAVALTPTTQLLAKLPFDASPEELAIRSRDIIRALGYTQPPADVASGFRYDARYLDYMKRNVITSGASARTEWNRVLGREPSPVSFWYRQNSAPFSPPRPVSGFQDRVQYEPLTDRPGTLLVEVDLKGRIQRFVATPVSVQPSSGVSPDPDWRALFTAAGLDITRFERAEPRSSLDWVSDHRVSWAGEYPGGDGLPVRLDAASFRGAVTYFEVVFPWAAAESPREVARASMVQVLLNLLVAVVVGIGARYQWKSGRGDPRGAWRVGVYVFVTTALTAALAAHDATASFGFGTGLLLAVFNGVVSVAGYVALEPLVRRHRPQALITWGRLLMGRWRDPAVGRDVLLGVLCGTIIHPAIRLGQLGVVWFGVPPAHPVETMPLTLVSLLGGRLLAAVVVGCFYSAMNALPFLFVFLVARLVVRSLWLAALVCVALFAATGALPTFLEGNWLVGVGWVFEFSALMFVVLRFGLLTGVAFVGASLLIRMLVVTSDLGAWYGQGTLAAVVVGSAIALWACRTSLGGRPFLGSGSLTS